MVTLGDDGLRYCACSEQPNEARAFKPDFKSIKQQRTLPQTHTDLLDLTITRLYGPLNVKINFKKLFPQINHLWPPSTLFYLQKLF